MARLRQGLLFDLPAMADHPVPDRHDDRSVASPSRQARHLHADFDRALSGSGPAAAAENAPDDAARAEPEKKAEKEREREEARARRFLAEVDSQGQGETASARPLVRFEREYGGDLLAGGLLASDAVSSPAAGRQEGRSENRPAHGQGASAVDVLFESARPAWQIQREALALALAIYPADLALSHGFWNRVQQLVDQGRLSFSPSCDPLLQRCELLDTSDADEGRALHAPAPIEVESFLDPTVPTLKKTKSPVISLENWMRQAGGF